MERFPVLPLDSEGHDKVYYLVGWVGKDCLEVAIFGPYFVPKLVVNMLRLSHVYVVGRSVHSDIGFLLGRATGYRELDLSVLTLDLMDSCSDSQTIEDGAGDPGKGGHGCDL